MRLLVATRSPGKQREARALLAGAPVDPVFPEDLMLAPHPDEGVLELHDSFDANARAKAEYFAKRSGLATLADDSGLEVFALGGEPGPRSKRWAGEEGSETQVAGANNAMLLRRLLGAPPARRRARYRCALAFVPRPGGIAKLFEGMCHGEILTAPRGTGGFGYDPLFRSDDLGKTFGEATGEEKQAVSHRARAFQLFVQSLREAP